MAFPKKLRHKFGAIRSEEDGIKFASLLEKKYYKTLKMRQQAGDLLFFLRQVPLHLPGNVRYVIDFVEFIAPKNGDQGDVIFTEVKGYMTEIAKLKIKQAEEIYGISINIVK